MKILAIIIAAVGVLFAAIYFSPRGGTGVDVTGCTSDYTNSSTTVNTTATTVLTRGTYNCGALLKSDNPATMYCWLEDKTAASSSMQANSGKRLESTTSTNGGSMELALGNRDVIPDAIPYRGNVNCIAQVQGRMLILRK